MHEKSCFVTLTYDEDHLPAGGTLVPREVQLFVKRLRKELPSGSLRYFLVGEYGDKDMRPHYHLALFGYPNCLWPSRKLMLRNYEKRACDCINCQLLLRVWGKGFIDIEELNPTTAQYIAGYTVKKMTSKDDVRLLGKHPEFARMSNRPGLAAGVIEYLIKSITSPSGDFFLSDTLDVPQALKHGKTALPLGRYLIKKFRESAGVDGEISKKKLLEEMQTLWFDAIASTGEAPQSLKQLLVSNNEGRVRNIEAKHNLYSKKGSL